MSILIPNEIEFKEKYFDDIEQEQLDKIKYATKLDYNFLYLVNLYLGAYNQCGLNVHF